MRKLLGLTAAAFGSLFIVMFQLQLLPFFLPLFVNDKLFWPVIYYGCWSLVIGLTLVILATQRSIFQRSLPILVVCVFVAGLTLIHPIDNISKNFIVAILFVVCVSVLAIASAPLALLRFSALATVLSAAICLLDILFTHGFTNSVGRAAGLSVNANVAAAGLLLGAASSHWAVPRRLRGPFLSIVGAAIFVTLSRSTFFAAAVICAGVGADVIWTRIHSPESHPRTKFVGAAVLTLGLAGWIVAALFANDRFSVAATGSFQQIGSALTAFGEARQSIFSALQSRARSPSAPTTAATNDEIATKSGRDESMSTAKTKSKPQEANSNSEQTSSKSEQTRFKPNDLIEEMGRRAEDEGDINSISARGLLMERAFLAYRTGPLFGRGLAAAHALHPHNTFLLFAIAFGDLGWVVPIAFLGLTIYWARTVQQLPLFLATMAVMTTSHDIPFTPGLLAPITFGMAGLNALRYRATDESYAFPAMRYTAVATPIPFAVGGASIAGFGTASVAVAPSLLIFLVFGAITLWSVAVWLWYEKPVRTPERVLPGGPGWD